MMNIPHISDIEQSFKGFLDSIGHPLVGEMKFDTQNWPRYDCPLASKGNQNVSYKVHTDGLPCLKVQCHKCYPETITCKYDKPLQISPAQRQAIGREAEKRRKEEDTKRAKALIEIHNLWVNAKSCVGHSYFERKGLSVTEADGLKIDNLGRVLCPIRLITGELISIQTIPSEGKKLFHALTSPKNGFHIFGSIEPHSDIFFAEGIATSMTVKECLNKPVVCVYGKRFSDIAPIIAKAYPGKKFVYCCDLPSEGEKVTSQDDAKKAIALVGGNICLPDFSEISHELKPEISRSDFNDLFCLLLEQQKTKTHALLEIRGQIQNSIQENCNMNGITAQNVKQPKNEEYKDNIKLLKIEIQKRDYPELSVTQNGMKPLNTYGNLKYMLNRLGISVRWNDMSRTREVSLPNFPIFHDDEENSALNEIINLATIHNMPTTKIDEHLNSLAQQDHYHPIVECINSKPWDGIPRLDQFIATVKTTNDDLSRKLIRRWVMSAIAAAFSEKGFSSQGVLVLQGKQNIGKTAWVKSLDPINCSAIKEGALLDPTNKDNIITLARHWIVELGELDGTFRKADIARLKSHITNQIDEVRAPYARKNSRLARRTVYVATVNESHYLVDDTGNRRWWTVEVESIDLNHGLDMQQVWAEVYHLWICGEQTWLSNEELNQLNESNTEHEQIDPLEEKILKYFDWEKGWENNQTQSMTASKVLEKIGYDKPNRTQATRMGNILKKHTGKKPQHTREGSIHVLPRSNPSGLIYE